MCLKKKILKHIAGVDFFFFGSNVRKSLYKIKQHLLIQIWIFFSLNKIKFSIARNKKRRLLKYIWNRKWKKCISSKRRNHIPAKDRVDINLRRNRIKMKEKKIEMIKPKKKKKINLFRIYSNVQIFIYFHIIHGKIHLPGKTFFFINFFANYKFYHFYSSFSYFSFLTFILLSSFLVILVVIFIFVVNSCHCIFRIKFFF